MFAKVEALFLHDINALIDQRLRPALDGDIGFAEASLSLACRHLCVSDRGKKVRPLLCLYFHNMLGKEFDRRLINIGVAAEFIHGASLLHDDIIDEAEKRRGKSSVNRQFGNAHAVLAGDFLLTESFDLLRTYDRALIDRAIVVVREMTLASMLEYSSRGQVMGSVDKLFTISRGKTGALFAWCGFAVGILNNDENSGKIFAEVGESVGLIFQLADDIKDFDGDHHLKDACRDIRNRELSLPIMLACEQNRSIKDQFEAAFKKSEIDQNSASSLKDLIMNSNALSTARAMMAREIDRVMTLLCSFQNTEAKTALLNFVTDLQKACQ